MANLVNLKDTDDQIRLFSQKLKRLELLLQKPGVWTKEQQEQLTILYGLHANIYNAIMRMLHNNR